MSDPDRFARRSRHGFTIVDLAVLLAVLLTGVGLFIPLLGAIQGASFSDTSLANLRILGAAHATYAADWEGRQLTYTDDALSTYGNNLSTSLSGYEAANGHPHPPLILGTTPPNTFWVWTSGTMLIPMGFGGFNQGFGAFRVPNAGQFNQYVGGRFYDEPFFAPADQPPYDLVEPAFSSPWGYMVFENIYLSSYCLSPAAMFDPDVMANPAAGGWNDPFAFSEGFRSPPLWAAMYPDLKTHMVEHHWVQNALADPCNPNLADGRYAGCEPFYFNHSLLSEPATLFYDGSTRLLPVTEAINANDMTVSQLGYGLWSIDSPMAGGYEPHSGAGYFNDIRYDSASTGFHILTSDGIFGRDTIALPAALKSRRLKRLMEPTR